MPHRQWCRRFAFGCCLTLSLLTSACHLFPTRCEDDACLPAHGPGAGVAQNPTVMTLAHDLDKLEKHIELYGSVVPKVPDVWGQARLTRHREDFERLMAAELGNFQERVNGALTRADSSFFSQTAALGVAAQSRPQRLLSGTRTLPGGLTETTFQSVNVPPAAVILPAGTTLPTNTDTKVTNEKGQVTTVVVTPPAVVAPAPTQDTKELIAKNVNYLPGTAIGIEPTLLLQQKKRYLDLLNQIRRTNEGDDTADSPGYSLNLVRVPVSILPGKKTDVGYGAEITFTLTPVLSDDLLPSTYRSLIINDVADQLGFPLVRFLEDTVAVQLLTDKVREQIAKLPDGPYDDLPVSEERSSATASRGKTTYTSTGSDAKVNFLRACQARFKVPTVAPTKGLLARAPFPNSQILQVYGPEFCFEIAYQAHEAFKDSIKTHGYAHLPDIQSFLLSELNASYRFLADVTNQQLWTMFCTPELVTAVRNHDYASLVQRRRAFRDYFLKVSSLSPSLKRNQDLSVTSALAWCILVDAAMLNDRLIQDMKETATSKGCAPFCGGWLDFFAPNPSPDARRAFNEYVRCRWPVRVFALDPETQDQNLIDDLSTRRETQLALAMAFVSGRINARTLTTYSRKLEAQYETIALNRPQVGFSHGENTFGWRFAPRFQTPDTESNITVLVRDQLIGGPNRNALLRQRRLEPGPRECVAVVLMPSFVPTLTCDSVSNWFDLANPKHKKFDHTDAMKASRAVRALQVHGPNVQDAECYRAGDFPRLLRRVEQLEARLPTQTATVPVPVANTLGGFEMFNNGTTDLAPELYGFYGAPGARIDSPTTLFLVGDHFSALNTKVIIGNQECDREMLSRQVMKVRVPGLNVPTKDGFIHAHVATPYGVSREIEIPVATPLVPGNELLVLDTSVWAMSYQVETTYAESGGKLVPQYNYKLLTSRPSATNLAYIGGLTSRPGNIVVQLAVRVGDTTHTVLETVSFGDTGYTIPVAKLMASLLAKVKPSNAQSVFVADGTAVVPTIKITDAAKPEREIKVQVGPSLHFTRAQPAEATLPAPMPR